jgi:hypothetical protein
MQDAACLIFKASNIATCMACMRTLPISMLLLGFHVAATIYTESVSNVVVFNSFL